MLKRAHVYVSGRVQGVFFRAETAKLARELNVSGFVRNLSDGRVEAVFEGEADKVQEMVRFCERGPPGARVVNLDVRWEEPKDDFKDFRIVYR